MSSSFVLASLRSSTGTRPPHHSAARTDVVLRIRRTVRPRGYVSGLRSLRPCLGLGASRRARVERVEKSGHFEHPANHSCVSTSPVIIVGFDLRPSFTAAC